MRRDRCIHLPILGLINSSTISEVHGLLVGICTRGPAHLGIDNKAVVDRACYLLQLADKLCHLRDDEDLIRTRDGLAFEVAR